jgi:hypothetical protein
MRKTLKFFKILQHAYFKSLWSIYLIFGNKGRASCRNSFKAQKILMMASIYILEVMFYEKVSVEY